MGNEESEHKGLDAQRDWCLVDYGECYVVADGPVVVQPKEMYELIYPQISLGWYQIYLSTIHAIKLDTYQ